MPISRVFRSPSSIRTATTSPPRRMTGLARARRHRGPLSAIAGLPGSKSLTNRELVLAALADGPSPAPRPAALARQRPHDRGAARARRRHRADAGRGQLRRRPARHPAGELHGGDRRSTAGSPARSCASCRPLAALALGPVAFDGDETAPPPPDGRHDRRRCAPLGVDIDDDGRGALPFTVHGTGTVARRRARRSTPRASSQFVSGLLLAAPRFDVGPAPAAHAASGCRASRTSR